MRINSSSDRLFEVHSLRKSFGGLVAVDDFDFAVSEREILGLIGPNGAGKTTVFNCLMKRYRQDDGRILFRGEDISDLDTHEIVNRGIARVTQHSEPIESMTVRENIRLFTVPNSIFSLRGGASDEKIRAVAERLAIDQHLDRFPDDLTHEDNQRLSIARAVATEPDLLLIDEPFAGLTSEEIRDLSDAIEALRADGITVITVDHNMHGLMQLVDRVVVIYDGNNLVEGPPEEIANDSDVADVYLGRGGAD